jgi:hypothetical protein
MFAGWTTVLFICHPQVGSHLYVKTRLGANPGQTLARIEAIVKKANPGYPCDYRYVDEQFNSMFANERRGWRIRRRV